MPTSSPAIVCLASYFKGADFLRECRRRGCYVILVVKEKLKDEDWPRESIDEIVTVPNAATSDGFVEAVSGLARHRRLRAVVALEEFDVIHAALVREHLRIPGMGTTTARLFRDKLAMRVKASEAGIRVPYFVHVLNVEEIEEYMRLVSPPWVLKPRSDVSAVGIQKVSEPDQVRQAIEALDARPALAERSTHYLLEQFIQGQVYHVDALVEDRQVVFAGVHRYWRPPMEVAHEGGVFVTCTVERGSDEEQALLAMNRALLAALNFVRGATHAEFIRSERDGRFYFLEVAARVGGAFIAETLEAASGVNIWREWAAIELATSDAPYRLPPVRRDYAGLALALARQEWPETDAYTDPEIVQRVRKRHHVGLIVRSPDYGRVQTLLGDYAQRFMDDFVAVLPPLARSE
jgi:biotin carboxylase